MTQLLKVDSIMYRVSNLESAADFYKKNFGMQQLWSDKANGMIGLGFPNTDAEIVLHVNDSIPNPDFSFLVANVEEACSKFSKQGHKVFLNPIQVRTGKFAILEDLDGNKIPIIDLTKFGGNPKYDKE